MVVSVLADDAKGAESASLLPGLGGSSPPPLYSWCFWSLMRVLDPKRAQECLCGCIRLQIFVCACMRAFV